MPEIGTVIDDAMVLLKRKINVYYNSVWKEEVTNKMILYHASKVRVEFPEIRKIGFHVESLIQFLNAGMRFPVLWILANYTVL